MICDAADTCLLQQIVLIGENRGGILKKLIFLPLYCQDKRPHFRTFYFD